MDAARSELGWFAAILVVGLLAISSGLSASATARPAAFPLPGAPQPGIPTTGPVAHDVSTPGLPAAAQNLLNAVRASGAPRWATFLPALDNIGDRARTGNHIAPLYGSAPSPMGVADWGIQSVAGNLTPYLLNTSSVQGTLDLSSVAPFYEDDAGPYTFGSQLNTVMANVTVLNSSIYSFWTQNVIDYSADTHALTFIDNIWNFSSPSGYFPSSTLYSWGGNFEAPSFYYDVGPTFTIAPPFLLNLYTNTSVIDGRVALFFNYTLTNSTGSTVTGSYDEVQFNSTTVSTPAAHYEVNGYNYSPIGLPYDAELTLGGPGGGSTQDLQGIQATMQLQFWNNSSGRYLPAPSAYSSGTDTGETVSGVAEWWSAGAVPTVHLGPGPSFIQPLWGAGGIAGMDTVTGTVTPANAWAFITNGSSYNATRAQWSPMPASGSFSFELSPVTPYTAQFMLGDYASRSYAITGSVALTVALVRNLSLGLYTPLTAWDNAELAAISSGGNGTVGNPYQILNNQYSSLSPEFSQVNDFLFPVFYGLLLANTNAFVDVDQPASFQVFYNSALLNLTQLENEGFPTWNDLQIEMYNVSNVSVIGASAISGWFFSTLGGWSAANLLLWNSSNILIADNTFLNQGSAVMIYGGTNDTIWGNQFLEAVPAVPFAMNGGSPVDLTLYSSGDLIYNNDFAAPVPFPALTPYVDIYDGAVVLHTDTWNVSPQPAGDILWANGYPLFGNILGGSTEGGNFWWDYGLAGNPYGVLPYNSYGGIFIGGDYEPLTAPLYTVSFVETGLPAGQNWAVSLDGISTGGVAGGVHPSVISFLDPMGSYPFTVLSDGSYAVSPGIGSVDVTTTEVTVDVTFLTPFTYPVTVTESGLAIGASWTLELEDQLLQLSGPSFRTQLGNGTYPYVASSPDHATVRGNLTVNGAPASVVVPLVDLNATLLGTVRPGNASVFVDGASVNVTGGKFTLSVLPGVHLIEATVPGYLPYSNNVSAGPNQSVPVLVALTPKTSPTTPANQTTSPIISMTLVWAVVGGLIIVAIAVLIGALLIRSGRPEGERPYPSQGLGGPAPPYGPSSPPPSKGGPPGPGSP
jgi:thermopsin